MGAYSDEQERMWFSVLGPLRVWRGEQGLDLGATQVRAVLTLPLVAVDKPASVSELIDGLWGVNPPANAVSALQRNIGLLRCLLEPDLAPVRAPG